MQMCSSIWHSEVGYISELYQIAPGWLQTHDLPAPSRVLGSQVWTTMPGFKMTVHPWNGEDRGRRGCISLLKASNLLETETADMEQAILVAHKPH